MGIMRHSIKCVSAIGLYLFNKILFQLIELGIIGYMKGTIKLCVSITNLNLFFNRVFGPLYFHICFCIGNDYQSCSSMINFQYDS